MTMRAEREGLFASVYEISLDGRVLTRLELTRIRSGAAFELDGEWYEVHREGVLRPVYVLERQGREAREVARAEQSSRLPAGFQVRADNRGLALRARFPGRRFVVQHGDRRIGEIRPARLLSRSAVLEGMDELAPSTRVFLLTIVVLRWRQQARSSGG